MARAGIRCASLWRPLPLLPAGNRWNTLDELVEDLEALRERLGHERIHVIGHSLGGMIGPAYARAHPDRVLSVGLLSTAAGRLSEDRAKVRAVGVRMESEGIAEVLPTLVARWYTDDFCEARPDLIEKRIGEVNGTRPDVCLAGGLTHCKKIAAVAESFNVGVIPHNPLTPISTAACVQLDACIPNFVLQEYTGEDKPPKSLMVKKPLKLVDGYLEIPEVPGP